MRIDCAARLYNLFDSPERPAGIQQAMQNNRTAERLTGIVIKRADECVYPNVLASNVGEANCWKSMESTKSGECAVRLWLSAGELPLISMLVNKRSVGAEL